MVESRLKKSLRTNWPTSFYTVVMTPKWTSWLSPGLQNICFNIGGGELMRRGPTPQQGRALEVLGHAIEYLMDSYVIVVSTNGGQGDREAIQLLMRLNMEVFVECEKSVPVHAMAGKRIYSLIQTSIGQQGIDFRRIVTDILLAKRSHLNRDGLFLVYHGQ